MYYSKIRIDPTNPEIAYQGGAPFFKTVDGGKTWRTVDGPRAQRPPRDLDQSARTTTTSWSATTAASTSATTRARPWEFINTMAVGQFYAISADMRKPYVVCGGLQDNGSWCGPSATRSGNGILNSDWYRIGGGDGFYTQNDPTDWTIGLFGIAGRQHEPLDLRTGSSDVDPAARAGRTRRRAARRRRTPETPAPAPRSRFRRRRASGQRRAARRRQGTNYRFYWNTPFILSPHNPRTVYLGADRLFRSYDRGDTWMASPDLTNNIGRNDRPIMGVAGTAPMASKHDGAASYSNIVTIGESPLVPGIVWVGTNDGNVQVSRDGGNTWKNVVDNVPGVPKETHVSRVEPSHFDAGTCYVTFDGHRTDDHKPYVFMTTDFGETWTSISRRTCPRGTSTSSAKIRRTGTCCISARSTRFYISLNGGDRLEAVHDGPADRAHRRHHRPSARQRSDSRHARPQHLHHGRHHGAAADDRRDDDDRRGPASTSGRPSRGSTDIQKAITVGGAKHFRGQNPARGTAISYWLKSEPSGDVRITITDVTGREIRVDQRHEDGGPEPRAVGPRHGRRRPRARPGWWRSGRSRRLPAAAQPAAPPRRVRADSNRLNLRTAGGGPAAGRGRTRGIRRSASGSRHVPREAHRRRQGARSENDRRRG